MCAHAHSASGGPLLTVELDVLVRAAEAVQVVVLVDREPLAKVVEDLRAVVLELERLQGRRRTADRQAQQQQR